MPTKTNPELIARAHKAAALLASGTKESFVGSEGLKAGQEGMPPGAPMPPGGAPMDPAMQGGAPPMPPGAPMPPAPPMPAGPPAPPGAPMPPEMGGPPPAGAPPEGMGAQPVMMNMEDLVALFEQIAGQESTGEGDNEPTTTNVRVGERIERLEGKLDDISSLLAQVMGMGEGQVPPGGGGAMPPGAESGEVDPGLLSALGGGGAGMPPGGPMGAEGEPMPPEMAGGMPPPQAMPGGPGMVAAAAEGRPKLSVQSISKMAAQLRRK